MSDAFISYRRQPSAALAHLFQEKLKNQYNIVAYVDTTRTDSTKVQFPDRLMEGIAKAPVFVCILGNNTLESVWVLKEIEEAYRLKKRCVPIFQEAYVPMQNPPPAVAYMLGFDGVHIMDIKSIFIDESVKKLALLIKSPRNLSRILLGFVALLIVVIFAGVLLYLPNFSSQGIMTPMVLSPIPTVEISMTPKVSSPTLTSKSLLPTPSQAVTHTPAICEAVVIVNSLNFRTGPSTAYPVIEALLKETRSEVIGRLSASDWIKVRYNSREGWISALAEYIQITCSLSDLPVLSPPPTLVPSSTRTWTPTPSLTKTISTTEQPTIFTFSGTLNYDVPTPNPPAPLHQFTLGTESQTDFFFSISPVWAECGFWWRVDSINTTFYHFGGHIVNSGSHYDSVSLVAGSYKLQVGVSYSGGRNCSGAAAYQVTVNA